MDAPVPTPRCYLDAALTPTRSLSGRGVWLLMIPLVVMNLAVGGLFLALGGVFVPPFLGLDVLGVGLALWFNFRAARRVEHVYVSADEIRVTRDVGGAARTVWTSAPAFTRLDLSFPGRHASKLKLFSKGRGVTLAAALAPTERKAFAETLEAALAAARAERW